MGKYLSKCNVVYLDQKDWIYLARQYYDQSLTASKDLSNTVIRAADTGSAIFPLSIVHFDETLRRLSARALTPKILLQEITKYDFGWAGFNATKNKKHLDVTLPNKLFEYIACGLPVLSFPHRTQKQIIEEQGVGFVFHDIEELVELLNTDLVHEKRKTVLKKRHDFTIEKNIGSVKDFYEKTLN